LARTEIRNLLVIGIDTVFVAASAKRAGYNVYAVDYFDDIDLQHACAAYKSIKNIKILKAASKLRQILIQELS
jgi:predicted ATP-grasp superfamily ATP-dependent carboligase